MPGPTTTITGDRYGNKYSVRIGYTTAHGVKRVPLPHNYYEVLLGSNTFPTAQDLPNLPGIYEAWGRGDGDSIDSVQNKARSRFFSKVHGDVQGLVNLAEFRQTWSTLDSLLGALKSPTQAFKEAFQKYAKASRHKSHDQLLKTVLRDSSEGWLAWHFGMEPLLKDIYGAAEILAFGVPKPKKLRASAKGKLLYSTKHNDLTKTSWKFHEAYQLRCKYYADVEVTNPNLWLANSLGFVNPAAVAWELVPWSFAIDWVIDIGGVLQSLSDEFGVTLTNAASSQSCHVSGNAEYQQYVYPKSWHRPGDPKIDSVDYSGYRWQRTLGIGYQNLGGIKTAPWSITRIGTAVALIISNLPR